MSDWIRGIAAAGLLSLLCVGIAGDRRVVRLASGLVLLLALLSPLGGIDLSSMSELLAQTRAEAQAQVTQAEAQRQTELETSIRSRTETYILDKAAELGMEITVQVELTQGAQYPYPGAVHISGRTTAAQRARLGAWIAAQLAVPEEQQTWNEQP